MIKCNACHRQVIPTKTFAWPWFLLWLCVAVIGGLFYLIYYFSKAARECPYCGEDVYQGHQSYNSSR